MITLSSTQVNQINSLLRLLKIQVNASSHPDWPIWQVATKLLQQNNELRASITKLQNELKHLETTVQQNSDQITQVARNAAVSKTRGI